MKDKDLFNEMKSFFKVTSLEDVAEKLGYKRTTASTWRSRGLPNVVKLKYSQYTKSNNTIIKSEIDNEVTSAIVKLHYYPNISASAGYGISNEDDSHELLEISRPFLIALGLRVFKNLDLIRVSGDSMEPFISNGEMVIVERAHEAKNNEIVIANINGEVYVKKLQRDPFGKCVKLISANPLYMDIELKEDELEYLKIIGVVRAKIRPF